MGGFQGGEATWGLKSLKTLTTLNSLRHPGDFAWEWRQSLKQVMILRESGDTHMRHSRTECSLLFVNYHHSLL